MNFNTKLHEIFLCYKAVLFRIKFVSDLRQIGSFLPVSSTNKTDRHDITEILLKVVLNIMTPNPSFSDCSILSIQRQRSDLFIWNVCPISFGDCIVCLSSIYSF